MAPSPTDAPAVAPSTARPVRPRYAAAGRKTVWLTFDDGPHPRYTPKVLEVLAAHGVRATFFLIGSNARLYPRIVERIAREGHGIANHTWRHPNLAKLPPDAVREEIRLTDALLAPYMGGRKLFRPPYGAHNATVDAIVASFGYRMVLWNVDTVDWSKAFQPDRWVDHGIAQIAARASSLVLNHDIHKTTAANLDTFLRRIKAIRGAGFAKPATL
ncbi:MAG: polysaccharide deacetylase family protein [Rhodobacteraceae bacterium]|jgi:peptidoglycan/xylan/chitin deacetylase (PgdA/CDA1 family)|nr:polysaccharide deacetylase family protein [Paracoccaceae bacterium]